MDFANLGQSLAETKGVHTNAPFFLQLFVIMATALIMGRLARRVKQPEVVGWIIGGIMLGASGLGILLPTAFEFLFHPSESGQAQAAVTKILDLQRYMLAELGLVFFLFLTGLEFNFGHLQGKGRATLLISSIGIAAPFLLGWISAPYLLRLAASDIPLLSFRLIFGTCLSITALPILGKIMKELGITQTKIGTITISAGGIDDVVGWILLAAVSTLVSRQFNIWSTLAMIGATILFAGFMLLVTKAWVGPWIEKKLAESTSKLNTDVVGIVLLIVVAAGICTEYIGIYALFGAFFTGATLSSVKGLREVMEQVLEPLTRLIFLPLFFTYAGLHIDLRTFASSNTVVLGLVVVAIAVIGKLGGCTIAARLSGFSLRESICIGSLMNCRALMGLIAATVGLSLGVLPPSIYSMLVLVALVTTIMTNPLVLWFMPGTELEEPIRRSGFLGPVAEKPLPRWRERKTLRPTPV